MAKKNNYDVLEINLEAEYSVLENRFDKCVATALTASNTKISNTSKKRFKELFNLFEHEKNLSALTFRTDIQTEKEILNKILDLF